MLNNKDVYELTNPQKSIWYTEQFFKGSSVNTICGTIFINEPINIDILKNSICHVIKNHNCFSLNFTMENNKPKQFFCDLDFNSMNFLKIVKFDSMNDLISYRKKIIKNGLNVENNILFGFYIFQVANGPSGFFLNIHHLLADSWSLGLTCNEIIKTYQALKHKKSPEDYTSSYLDYINSEQEYLNSNKYIKDKDFWSSLLLKLPDIATLPGTSNTKSSLESCSASRKSYSIPSNLVSSIKDFCTKNKISTFNFFMAVYGIYIGKTCNLDDFIVGTPILNRCNFKDKKIWGMFISTIPFVIHLKNDITFSNFVSLIAKDSLNMLRHQRYPYQSILEEVRKENKTIPNLYNILLSYQITNNKNTGEDIEYTTEWNFNGNCANPINIHMYDFNDTGKLHIDYDYQTSIYTLSDIMSVHNRILNIINQILSNPNVLVSDIEIVTPSEKEKILYEFNKTDFQYNDSLTVVDLFEAQVSKTPDKLALVSNNISYTYKSLNEKANMLAYHLRDSYNVKPTDIIGIMLNRSPEMIIGLLAILKCGAAYLPIDPDYPNERISYMLENSKTKIVLVNNSTEESIPVKYTKVNISLSNPLYQEKHNAKNLSLSISSDYLAYLIYTSGSTGKPKGVMLTHKNLHNFIVGMKKIIDFNENKTMVSLTTICFDIFGLELWCSVTSGLTLVLANELEQNSPELLNKLCIKNHVNMIQTTPSRYTNLLSDKNQHAFLDEITDIMVGGEAMPKNLLQYLKEISTAKIYNMYGPTETTIWSTVKNLTDTDIITVGKPIANTQCYILDKNQKLLPPYTAGELYIGGDGVSKGYLHRKALNDEKFINSPFIKNSRIYNTNDLAYFTNDGEIVHLGRTDFQVKIRGYRIELGEIESRIIKYSNISNAVVVPDSENKYLVCYYVASEEIKVSKLISYLLKHLPNYMIPAYFKKLDEIPLTPNGKIDRKSLPKIKDTTTIELAKTETEKIIVSSLSKILNTDKIDINTPFLSLGLDSLGLIQLQTSLLAYNLNLTTQSFYRYPSVKRLAKRIDSHTEYYTEFNFQIPNQFKHADNELAKDLKCDNSVLGNVLLTGANGFIGAHVLHELLKNTNSKIYCFVRGENIPHSIQRLEESYNYYFNESLEPYLNSRVLVYNAQITLTNFGLFSEQINDICNNINTIIHTAAIVKHYGNFEQFKSANIDGTKMLAEFSYTNKKRLIHISSISVSGNYLVRQDNQNVSFSENDLYIGQHYTNNVYVNSKFDAEKIVYSFMEKGLTAEVLRVGILAGRYEDGYFQKNIADNAFYSRIKSLIDLKKVSQSMLEQEIEFTPVDLCARAIVLLAKTKDAENKVYHLYNHKLTSIQHVLTCLKKIGINIETISEKDFESYILKLSKDEKSRKTLKGIINDISFTDNNLSLDYGFTVNVSSKFTINTLAKLGFTWPEVDDLYLKKLLDHMRKVKFI